LTVRAGLNYHLRERGFCRLKNPIACGTGGLMINGGRRCNHRKVKRIQNFSRIVMKEKYGQKQKNQKL